MTTLSRFIHLYHYVKVKFPLPKSPKLKPKPRNVQSSMAIISRVEKQQTKKEPQFINKFVLKKNSSILKGLVYFYKNNTIVDEGAYKLFEEQLQLYSQLQSCKIIKHHDSIDSMPMLWHHFIANIVQPQNSMANSSQYTLYLLILHT